MFVCKDCHVNSSTYQRAALCLVLQRDKENNFVREMGFTPLLGDVSSDDTEEEILELSTASIDMSNRISNLAASAFQAILRHTEHLRRLRVGLK